MQQLKQKMKTQSNLIPFIPEGDFYFTKGVESFQKRKFDLAVKWMKKAVEAKPAEPLYGCQLSIIYTEIGEYHKANHILTDLLNHDVYIDCYYLLANNYAHLGLLSDAKKYAELYLEKANDGEFTEETRNLLELIDVEETDEDDFGLEDEDTLLMYQETAFYHMENSEWNMAIPVLEDMMALFPEHKPTRHDYAKALFFTGHRKQAVEMEEELLAEDPNDLYSYTNLALFFYELDEKEGYESAIQALLNIYPIHEQQKLRIAAALAGTGYYEEACRRFQSLKGIVTGQLSYYKWYSVTVYHLGKTDKAAALWAEGMKRHPSLVNESAPWDSY